MPKLPTSLSCFSVSFRTLCFSIIHTFDSNISGPYLQVDLPFPQVVTDSRFVESFALKQESCYIFWCVHYQTIVDQVLDPLKQAAHSLKTVHTETLIFFSFDDWLIIYLETKLC